MKIKNKKINLSSIETVISAEQAAKFAQERLDTQFVNESISGYTKESISAYVEKLIRQGKASTPDEAIDLIARNKDKGFAFEALLDSRHSGASHLNSTNEHLSKIDTQVDNEILTKEIFGAKIHREIFQAKSSVDTALEAIKPGRYAPTIIVPKDIFDQMVLKNKPEVIEAIKSGKLVYEGGQTGIINSPEAIDQAKRRLKEIYAESPQENFYKTVAVEVGKAATVGAAFRGGVTALKILVTEKKIQAKDLKVIGLESVKGGFETGARVGLARGFEQAVIKEGAKSGGKWLGRTCGAGAGLIVATIKDGYLLGRGKIDKKEFGLRFTKNSVVAIATAFSGPVGLSVSLSITAGELLYSENVQNNLETKQALKEQGQYDLKALRYLEEVDKGIGEIKESQDSVKKLYQEAKIIVGKK